MSLALEIIIGLVILLVVAVAALRIRKLRRDELREMARPVERRLVSPPPSPYAPSKGFRLLDGPISESRRPEPSRPRLESDREYVFSESQMPSDGEVVPTPLRHSEKWALSKSARRTTSFTGLRVAVIATIVVVLVGGFGIYLQHRHPKNTSTTTTTRPPSTTTTTALALPPSFVATSTSGQTASYRVPLRTYDVIVRGALGPTWAVYKMGTSDTLEWQGTVKDQTTESLRMIGSSQITIGAPRNASVTVEGKPVVFPSPLPSTLVLSFVAS
jgi:hypothetical protein